MELLLVCFVGFSISAQTRATRLISPRAFTDHSRLPDQDSDQISKRAEGDQEAQSTGCTTRPEDSAEEETGSDLLGLDQLGLGN